MASRSDNQERRRERRSPRGSARGENVSRRQFQRFHARGVAIIAAHISNLLGTESLDAASPSDRRLEALAELVAEFAPEPWRSVRPAEYRRAPQLAASTPPCVDRFGGGVRRRGAAPGIRLAAEAARLRIDGLRFSPTATSMRRKELWNGPRRLATIQSTTCRHV